MFLYHFVLLFDGLFFMALSTFNVARCHSLLSLLPKSPEMTGDSKPYQLIQVNFLWKQEVI